ncbi:MAG TPA: Fe-S oxidoreductase, partial [Myxococcota bacterium]
AMIDDVNQAIDTATDQICLYHLVLFEGLGTEWSKDKALLATLPSQDDAVANFLALREHLTRAGFVQTTLTNFERADVHHSDKRFLYEERSFSPATVDGLGIGPFGVSTFVDVDKRRAVKLMRAKDSEMPHWAGADLWFPYDDQDVRLLYLVRSAPRLRIERAPYRAWFGEDLVDEHDAAMKQLVSAELVTVGADALTLTPRGMFFADSVVGLLMRARAEAVKASGNGVHTMQAIHARSAHDFMG